MCGICGKLNFDRRENVSSALLKSMADTIVHRGPDDEGYYTSGPLGFGFRRLAIIDLNTGHQPLSNEDGTVWIVFNGEIYNYQELREQLKSKGHVFATQTDTEAIVHLYEEYGEECVTKLRGMFGFAIWDDRKKVLLLARDRLGIKPMYYSLTDRALVFGSEIKAILADPEVDAQIEPQAIDRFLSFDYVPGADTLLRNIHKLEAGCYLLARDGKTAVKRYWDLSFEPWTGTYREAESRLLSILEESVGLHMIADVPVGFLLSGGVDSTAMLGFAVGKTKFPLSSYTIGFSDPNVTDERPYARLAANLYGSEHHEMTISAADFRDFMPGYVWHMEEPVCEPPAVALYYISKLARNFVKVLISGEGGDEAFAGYPNYRNNLWIERLKRAAGPLRGALRPAISLANKLIGSERIGRLAPLLDLPFESYYFGRTSNPFRLFNQEFRRLYSSEFADSVDKEWSLRPATQYSARPSDDLVNRMLYVDTKTWLVDDLLLKADKMTMANSVELRVPLLDHKLIEFAASLPGSYKVRGLTTKYIAKNALSKRVPHEILYRKKTGFPVPYAAWMRNELKDWVRDIVLDSKAAGRGYFNKKAIESLLDDNMRNGSYPKEVFSLATLELWHRAFLEVPKPATVLAAR